MQSTYSAFFSSFFFFLSSAGRLWLLSIGTVSGRVHEFFRFLILFELICWWPRLIRIEGARVAFLVEESPLIGAYCIILSLLFELLKSALKIFLLKDRLLRLGISRAVLFDLYREFFDLFLLSLGFALEASGLRAKI
jgi:hypothetical protein